MSRSWVVAPALVCLVALGGCSDTADRASAPPATTEARPPPLSVSVPTTADAEPAEAPPASAASPAIAQPPLATPLPVTSGTIALIDDSRPVVSGGEVLSAVRPLTTWVWLPSSPAGGPWPLVVFAHGYEVGPAPYAALCEAWAAAGYVVAAPEFPLTDADVAGAYLDESDLDNQPDDVRFVIDALLAPDSPLAGKIDPDRLAVAGHSDGGVTALAVGSDPLPGLRGVIALSTSPVYGGSVPNPPLLVVQGDEDDINGFENGEAVYDQATAPRFFLTLLGGAHLPPFLDGSPYLDAVDKVAVDFLDHYVAGRTPTEAELLAGGDPELTTLDADP